MNIMEEHILYFIDESEKDGRANAGALERLLDAENVKVIPIKPYIHMSDYHKLIEDPRVKTLLIDQRMKSGSDVDYNGIELASFLRGHYSKFPIYILTAFKKSTAEFEEYQHNVEDIIGKDEIELSHENSKAVRGRILRRIAVYGDLLEETEKRFHDLLVRSITETLSPDELAELDLLDTERKMRTRGADLLEEQQLERALEILNKELESLHSDDE